MKVKIVSLLAIIFFIIIIWRLNLLSISTAEVTNLAGCVSLDQLNNEINSMDKNMILVNVNKLKDKLTSKYMCIKDVNVSYKFPKTIKVDIYGRDLLTKVVSADFGSNLVDMESSASSQAALLDWNFPSESSDDAFAVDDSGYVFIKVKSDHLIPTLFLNEGINLGKKLDQKTFNSVGQIFSKILTYVPISYQPNFKAKVYGTTLLVNSSPKLAFSLENDILRQLASLQLILQKAKIDERAAEFIDLRFDKPVVQYHTNLSK
ncbi:MAG: FtsQ-type POTRA domain-containing protein [Candidatus Daviesbacteria bacterium]|nr:FtsQ-type POTRA domain-containing protein [Candidatus Daviesbacteria bacterium]